MAKPRIDRLATLYFFRPLQRMMRSRNDRRIPILMYHSISREEERGVHPYYRVVTTPEVFDRHMAFLADQGYQVIGLDAAVSLLSRDIGEHQGMPDKPVVITFDDGFRNFYTTAFPILAHHGFTATMFLPTSFINTDDENHKRKAFLTWSQVSELAESGISFGSHTMSHGYLLGKTRAEVERELRQSKETIEERTGNPVRFFSYPYAFPENDKSFVAFLRSALKDCGYSCAVTTKIGTAAQGDDLLSLKRIPVNAADDLALLGAKIIGGYDWMHTAQYTAKTVGGMLGLHRKKSLAQWAT
jgi:peptidoglycan/xylan/chitin deacetylase (PgdA/CDA1 family)